MSAGRHKGATSVALPVWVSPEAARHWADIGPTLDRYGLCSTLDALAAGLLAETLADYIDARRLVEQHGSVKATARGGAVRHPAMAIRDGAFDRLLKLLAQFGMTPASRSTLRVRPLQPDAQPAGILQFSQAKQTGVSDDTRVSSNSPAAGADATGASTMAVQ